MPIDSHLDEIEDFLRSLPKGEANKYAARKSLNSAESKVALLIDRHGPLPRLLVLSARLAMELRQWNAAIVRWTHVIEQSQADRALAQFEKAKALRYIGDLPAAEAALQAAESGVPAELHEREKAALAAALQIEIAQKTIPKSIALLKRSKVEKGLSLLRTGLQHEGLSEGVVGFSEDLFRKIAPRLSRKRREAEDNGTEEARSSHQPGEQVTIASPAPDPASRPTRSEVQVVLSCGFGWSGSGAVTDYLRQFSPVATSFGTREMSWFEGSQGAKYLLAVAEQKPHAVWGALADFFLTQVIGVAPADQSLRRQRRLRGTSLTRLLQASPDQLDRLRQACRLLIDEVAALEDQGSLDRPGIEKLLARFFAGAIAAKGDNEEIILINNAIHAANVRLCKVVPNPRALVVVRDPRDQFVSMKMEKADSKEDAGANKYIRSMRSKYARYRRALEDAQAAEAVSVIGFESFVQSEETRRALLSQLGLSEAPRKRVQRFFPEVSRQNIGIHRDYPDQSAIARIHEELAPLLPQPTL